MPENNILLVTADGRIPWPFPTVNGTQTDASKALQDDKQAHKPKTYDLTQCEDALL